MSKKSVAVRILGQEYRIRSDADEEWLQHVAACVDTAMDQVRERTKTVDTLDVALLTCLNLAREVLANSAKATRFAVGPDRRRRMHRERRKRALIDDGRVGRLRLTHEESANGGSIQAHPRE